MNDYLDTLDGVLQPLWPFAASLGLGLLLGLERRQAGAVLGVREHALAALFGTLCALLGEAGGNALIVGAGLLVVGAAAVLAWQRGRAGLAGSALRPAAAAGPGAGLLAAGWCFSLGAMVWYGYTEAALLLAMLSAALLRARPGASEQARRFLATEGAASLQALLLILVLLPMVPDEYLGPEAAVNLYTVWALISVWTLLAWLLFARVRLHPDRFSPVLRGLIGGVLSSRMTVRTAARACRLEPATAGLQAAVFGATLPALAARMIVLTAIVAPKFLLPALAIGLAAALCALLVLAWQARKAGLQAREPLPEYPNPARLGPLATLAALFAGALALIAALAEAPVGGGLLGVITLAGLLLGEPAGLAPLTLGQTGVIGETDALTGLGCALAAIAVARWIGAWRHGGRRFAAACAPVVIATLIGIGAGVAIALARMPFDR